MQVLAEQQKDNFPKGCWDLELARVGFILGQDFSFDVNLNYKQLKNYNISIFVI